MSKGKRTAVLICILAMSASSCGGSTTAPPSPAQTAAPVIQTEAVPEESADNGDDEEGSGEDDTYTAGVQYSENSGLDGDDTEYDDEGEVSENAEDDELSSETTEEDAAEDTEESSEDTEAPEISEEETSAAEAVTEETATEETTTTAAETTSAETTTAAETTTEETTTTTAETTTVAETTTTEAVTTTTEETTTAAPVTQPAAPSPPKISPVSSPGTAVLNCGSAVIDYSNASSGYISVTYSGSTRVKMLLECGGVQYDYDIYAGTGTQYFTLSLGSGTYTADLYEMADNGRYLSLAKESFNASISDATNMYTYTNQFVRFNANSACVAKASEVCAGCTTNLEKVSAIFKYVTDTVTYDRQLAATVTGGYIPDPDSVLSKKTGICFDYASLTAAMLRSQGVPTKLIVGYAYPEIYHAWNEVYTPESGWMTIEIMLSNSGFNRIDATFYSTAADKQSFADYLSQSGSYSGVYVY